MNAIEVTDLCKSFGSLSAVSGLSFSVAPGELFGLIGPDGAGKTTSLRILAGIMAPTSGLIRILGHDVVNEPEQVKEAIGYMSQRSGLYPDLTVLEHIHFFADIFGVPSTVRKKRIPDLLDFSNLTPFGKRRAGNLSGGMKQKLGLACALIHSPRILLLDEPTNGVDPVSRRDFWRILNRLLQEGITIVVTTAYLDEAERCNRVGLIHQGKLFACADPGTLKQLVKGAVMEVRTTDPRAAAVVLQHELGISTVGVFGDRLHVVTGDATSFEYRMKELLGANHLSSRQIEPSLEDVFIRTMGTRNEDEGGHGRV